MMVRLKDICDVDWGDTNLTKQAYVENGKYLGVSAGGCDGRMDYYDFEAYTPVISAIGANCGKMFLPEEPFVAIKNTITLKPHKDILGKYIFYALNSNKIPHRGGGQPFISKTDTEEYMIICPSLEEQTRIVTIFDKICKIIDMRHNQLSKLDELVKSRFIEMFGNLVIGDKICTNKHKIGEIASVTKLAGFEFTKYIQYREQGDIIMLRGLNCKKGHLVLDDIKWIDKETSDLLPRSKLYYGDILMTYAGTIGDVAMVDADDKYHLAPNVAKITLTDKMAYNPIFLIHLFMYTNDYIMTFASVVAQASINMEKIRNFEYYFPSVEQQNAFATFVEQIDKSKFEIQKSLEKLETLKKALMQKYFG